VIFTLNFVFIQLILVSSILDHHRKSIYSFDQKVETLIIFLIRFKIDL